MKRDGNSCKVFHEKVDNQGPTITLFLSEADINLEGIQVNHLKMEVVGLKMLILFYLIFWI